jgi:hypothetical protein
LLRRENYREDGIYTFSGAHEEPRPTAVAVEVQAIVREQRALAVT